MTPPSIALRQLPGEYVVARLAVPGDASRALGEVLATGAFVSVTRTPQELSIVCPAGSSPEAAEIDGPWIALYAAGPIPFGMTGVVTSLVSPLSKAGCPVFVVSTYDGDVLMVPGDAADRARDALQDAGHILA
jgi:hypothetical protein